MSRLTRIKEVVLLLTALGIPLVFFGQHEDEPFNVPKLSLLIAGVGVAAGLHLVQIALGHRPLAPRSVLVPAAALSVPLTLAWVATPYREWALFGPYSRFTGLIPYIAFSILGILLVDTFRDKRERLAWGLAAVGGAVGLYAFLQSLGVDPMWSPGTDAGSPFPPSSVGHYNFSGGFLAISLPFSAFIWTLPRRARWGMATTVATVMGLLMTNSQGGWLAATVGLTIFAGAALQNRWRQSLDLGRLAAAAMILLVVVGIVLSAASDRPPLGGTAKSRGLLWGTAIEMAASSPLIGSGPGAYAVEGVRYRPLEYVLLEPNTLADDPHSVPLSFLANAGVVGAIGFIVLVVWIVRRGLRLDRDDILGVAFFSGAVAYLMQAMVSIDEPTLRAGLWVSLAGLALSEPRSEPTDGARSAPGPSGLTATLTIFLGVAFAVGGVAYASGMMRAHRDVAHAKDLFEDGDIAVAEARFERAIHFRFEPRYLSAYARDLGLAALTTEDERARLMDRVVEVNSYLDRIPQVPAYLETARLYLYLGHFDSSALDLALEVLADAAPLDPNNPEIDVRRSEVLLARGEPAEAVDVLEGWTSRLEGHLPGFWATLATARAVDGDVAGGRAALQHATALGTNDCRVLMAKLVFSMLDEAEGSASMELAIEFNCGAGDRLYTRDVIERYGL